MKTTLARLGACVCLASLAFPAAATDIYFSAAWPVWDVGVDFGPVSPNPTLVLIRGRSYNLHVSGLAGFHTFYINTINTTDTLHEYSTLGLSDNGINTDTGSTPITFLVPWDAPDTLYYNCSVHGTMAGQITVDGVFTDGFDQ